jgi:molybdenum cofactor cytidylyltransferase
MLRRAVSAALGSRARPVVVVLGAAEDEARRTLEGLDCEIVTNERWSEGQSTSVAAGVRFLRSAAPGAGAALFLLGDQPFVSAATLDALVGAYEAGATIAASESEDGVLRVPALFAAVHFDELEALAGDAGARELLRRHEEVARVPLPAREAADIDTPEDLARLGG